MRLKLRNRLLPSTPSSFWRLLALLFAILNLKSLPFAWHIRLLHGLLSHIRPRSLHPPIPASAALFQPVITSSRSSILECDYNIHKSNSTYFSDLDVSRMHHICCLMSLGMHKARTKITEERKGQFGVFLGGVTCSFRKEIKPYECFEIWTRVLTWDRKWLYLVSHVMRKGVVQPERYLLQPWKKSKSGNGPGSNGKSIPHGAIFATSVAKYVFKQGRMTIPPETMLEVSELLPKRPTDSTMPAGTGELSSSDPFVTGNSQPASQDQTVVPLGEDIDASLRAKEIDSWDWATMEQERRRGMGIADCMTGLDAVQDVFTGHTGPALGQF